MRILLINPWITDFAAYDFWVKPLGLLYAGAFLRARGHDIRLIDCMDRFQPGSGVTPDGNRFHTGKFHRIPIEKPTPLADVPRLFCRYGIPRERFIELLTGSPPPDTVLVTSVMTYWYHGVFETIALVRKHLPGVPIILGGIYATLATAHARRFSGADTIIASGMPRDIIEAAETITGVSGSGPFPGDDFGSWPEPPWDLYDTIPSATVMTSRGCPLACEVCASRVLFDGFERRSPESAVSEIIALAGRGAEDIAFADDALLLDAPQHAAPLFKLLAAEGAPVRLHTPNGLHIRAITPALARLMHAAGVLTIRLSLETSSEDRQREFSQKVTRDEFRTAAQALADAGFAPSDLGAYILVGLPDQTAGEVEDTIAFAASCGVPVRPALFSPVPHTKSFESAVAAGMIAPGDDPVLQNNTLRTTDWFTRWPGGYDGFRQLVDETNTAVNSD